MTYRVGTRIKKVSGEYDIGATGLVVGHTDDLEWDILVREDAPWYDCDGGLHPTTIPSVTKSSQWEPIIPEGSNVPSEASIHELLDSKFYEKENCNV